MSSVLDLIELELQQDSDACWFRFEIADQNGAREELAALLAADIARRLCEGSNSAFESWSARINGAPAHDADTKAELEAYLLADFTDDEGDGWTRLGGAVVEHLWALMAPYLEGGWGLPLHVEHEHFSVIDHGGDGLSIYEFGAPDLRFRLWESKQHVSEAKSVTTAVSKASVQLDDNAASYLARMSKPLQLHSDERVQQMAGRLVRMWTTLDGSAGVGVSVGTSGEPLPARPFSGLRQRFDFDEVERLEGLVLCIEDLQGFCKLVRAEVLKGIN